MNKRSLVTPASLWLLSRPVRRCTQPVGDVIIGVGGTTDPFNLRFRKSFMRCRAIALISTCLTMSHLADGAEPAKPGVYGAGAASCGVWLEERSMIQGGRSEIMLAWALGYMTGMDASGTTTTHLPIDEPGARTFLDEFCMEHPEAQFNVAAATLSISRYTTKERYNEALQRAREKFSPPTEASD